eukprot:609118-Pleurochrysis_carterae.AAC.1
MELTRSSLTSSGAPIAFWEYAVTHAVDILDRTCGPPNTNASSYELLTGVKPRIMSILPFGCRAFAVKPRTAYSKTTMDARAWLGISLGRSVRSPGAFNVWVPNANRIVVVSDVYFDELLFPWLDASMSVETIAQSCDGDLSQPPGLPPLRAETSDVALPASRPLRNAHRDQASTSRRVLLLFSGPFSRPDFIVLIPLRNIIGLY